MMQFENSLQNKFNKTNNKLNILEMVKNSQGISRASIARQTGLAKPTVSVIVDELIHDQLVIETGIGESVSGGRKPTMLQFNSNAYSVLGINFSSGNHFEIAEVDLSGNIIKIQSKSIDLFVDPDDALKIIIELTRDFFMREVSNPSKILGIGVGLPGYIDSSAGIVKVMYNFGWKNVNFSEQLYHTFHLPIFIDNEANALALAESMFATGKNYNNFIYIDISSGVGSGIIIDKKLYTGSKNSAGEIGHMIIDKNGPLCRCGKKGCLESHIAPYALRELLQNFLATEYKGSAFPEWAIENLTLSSIIKASCNGDPLAQKVLEEVCQYLGIAISNLINAFNPEALILGGEMCEANDMVFNLINTYYKSYSLFGEDVDIVPTSLGKYSGVLASASLVLRAFFSL